MATLQDALQKRAKKPFVKKEFRSYLSTDELDKSTDRPIDKPTNPGLTSKSDHVEASSQPSQQSDQVEPVQVEPVRLEPVQSAPVHSEPVASAPVHSAPVQTEPVRNEPDQDEPVHVEPVQAEPVQSEPVLNEPVQDEPVQDVPEQYEPVQSEPVQNERVSSSYFRLNLQESYRLVKELDEAELKIFLFLSLRAHGWDGQLRRVGNGTTRASRDYIATAIGMSETTVGRTTPRLEKKGLIKKSRVSCKTGNIWQVKKCLLSPVQSEPVHSEPVQNGPPSPSNLNGQNAFTRSKRTPNIDLRKKNPVDPSDRQALLDFCLEKREGKGLESDTAFIKRAQAVFTSLLTDKTREEALLILDRFFADENQWVRERAWSWSAFEARRSEYGTTKAQKVAAGHAAAWKDAP